MILTVRIFLLLLFSHVECVRQWYIEKDGGCEFTLSKGDIIPFAENPSLFVNLLKAGNLSDCRQSCCGHPTCNGYVWNDNEAENCKLLKCASEGQDCKTALKPLLDQVGHREVGFITGIVEATPLTTTTTTAKTTTTTSPQTKVQSSSSTKVSGVSSSNSGSLNLIDQLDEASNAHKLKETSNKENIKHADATTAKPSKTPDRVSMIKTTSKEDTIYLLLEREHRTHTDTVSLSVAFVFGIGFLITVLVLLGGRWFEGVRETHKRSYTRISYLLNGV